MSLIEGIGDEVLHFCILVLVISMAAIAWWSTNIAESPLLTTVLILERRTRTQTSNQTNDSLTAPTATRQISGDTGGNSIDTGQVTVTGDGQVVEQQAGVAAVDDGDNKEEANAEGQRTLVVESATSGEPVTAGDVFEIVEEVDGGGEPVNQSSDSSVLRRRRLAFFMNRGPTLIEPVMSSPVGATETTESASNSVSFEEEEERIAEVEQRQPQQQQQEQEATQTGTAESEPQSDRSAADNIRIRLKYLNDNQTVVEGRLQEQLGDFKRRHFSLELAAEKMVRLIFNGQVLHSDSQTLQGYGLFDNCVVHCLVHNQRSTPSRSPSHPSSSHPNSGQGARGNTGSGAPPPDWNLGTVLYASLSLFLGFALYCRYQYSYLFTVTTTAALFGLSAIFTVTLVGQFLPDSETIQ